MAVCSDTVGSFECDCKDGYSGNGLKCVDINECITGDHSCDAHAVCNNTDGGFSCECDTGYAGDGFSCQNIDECSLGLHNCDENAFCNDTDGKMQLFYDLKQILTTG